MMTFGIDFDMELLNGDSRDDVESGGFYFDSLMRHLFNFIFVRFPTDLSPVSQCHPGDSWP